MDDDIALLKIARFERMKTPYVGVFYLRGQPAYRIDIFGYVDQRVEGRNVSKWVKIAPKGALAKAVRAEYRRRVPKEARPFG